MDYLQNLRELVKKYSQEEIASALDVSTRSIQSYLSEKKPSVPHQKTQRRINDVYTKLIKEGLPLSDLSSEPNQEMNDPEVPYNQTLPNDYKDKYIALLERLLHENDDSKKALERELEEIKKKQDDLNINLAKLTLVASGNLELTEAEAAYLLKHIKGTQWPHPVQEMDSQKQKSISENSGK